MAKSFTISMILQMVNKVGGPAAAVIGALNKIDDRAKRAAVSLASMGEKMQNTGKKMMGSFGGTAALIAPVVGVMKFTATYETSMQKIASITGQTIQEVMDTYGKRAMKFARETGQRIEDIAQAQYDAISRNVPTGEVDAFIRSSLKTAKVGTTTVAITTKALAMLRNVWGEMPTEQMGGLLAQAQQFGGTEIAEISQNFGRVAMQLKNAGVTAEEGLSLVASLTQTGNIEESITGMAAMMRTIVKPTEQFTQEMKTLGINLSVSTIKEYGLAKSMKILQEAINRTYKTEDERIKAMGRAFNETMAFNAVLNFTSENGMDVYTKSLDSMKTSTDFLTNRSKQMGTTLTEESGKVRESFKGIMIDIGKDLMPAIRGAVEGLGSFVGAITNTVKASETLQDLIKGIGLAFIGIIGAVKIAGFLMWGFGYATQFAAGAMWLFSSIFAALKAAAASFGAFMSIMWGPVGLIAVGILAVILITILLIKHWDKVKKVAIKVASAIKEGFLSAMSAIGRAADYVLFPVFNLFKKIGIAIGEAALAGANFAANLAVSIGSGFMDLLRTIGAFFSSIGKIAWDAGKAAAQAFVNGFKSLPSKVLKKLGLGGSVSTAVAMGDLALPSFTIPSAVRPTGNAVSITLNGGINVTGGTVGDIGRQAWGALKPTLEAEIDKMNRNKSRKGMGDK